MQVDYSPSAGLKVWLDDNATSAPSMIYPKHPDNRAWASETEARDWFNDYIDEVNAAGAQAAAEREAARVAEAARIAAEEAARQPPPSMQDQMDALILDNLDQTTALQQQIDDLILALLG